MWQQAANGHVSHPFERLILAATLAMIPVLIIDYDVESGVWLTFAHVANWVIWALFAAEMVFILVVAPRKMAALRAHWLDVAVVVVTLPLYAAWLTSLRSARLFRLLRLVRAGALISRALQAERRLSSGNALRLAALATIFLTVLAGAVQSTVDTGDFATFWDGVWWAVVTVTTVGYGDLYPHTVPGRIVAIALMLAGIGFLAVLTATVASHFVQVDNADDSREILETLKRVEADLAELKASHLRG
jgi:voltage-gated potassium channel